MWIAALLACSSTFVETYGGGSLTADFGPEGNVEGSAEVAGASLACLETETCEEARLVAYHEGSGRKSAVERWFATAHFTLDDATRRLPCHDEGSPVTTVVIAVTDDAQELYFYEHGEVVYEAVLEVDGLDPTDPALTAQVGGEIEAELTQQTSCSELPTGLAGLNLTVGWDFDREVLYESRTDLSSKLVTADDFEP